MNPITLVEVRRLRGQIRACADLLEGTTRTDGKRLEWQCGCHCKSRIEHAWRVADQANSILKAGALEGTRSHDVADPVFALTYPAIAGLGTDPEPVILDPSPQWLEQLTECAARANTAIAELTGIVHVLGVITSSEPVKPGTSGQGNCLICDRPCTGVGEDRLRSGYCPACRVAYQRAGSPDRAEFQRHRREQLAAPEPFTDGSDIEERLNPGHQRAS